MKDVNSMKDSITCLLFSYSLAPMLFALVAANISLFGGNRDV